MEIFMVFYLPLIAFLFLLLWAVRSDWKDLSEGRDRLIREWDTFYAEARKYKEMDEITITYKDGETVTYVATGLQNKHKTLEIYGDNDVISHIINQETIKSIEVSRGDIIIPGSRNLGDDY